MTVFDLLQNVDIDNFSYEFDNEFTCYNAMCYSSKLLDSKIANLIDKKDLDWDEAFIKLGFYYNETSVSDFMSKYPDWKEDVFQKYLKLVYIGEDTYWGGLSLSVEANE